MLPYVKFRLQRTLRRFQRDARLWRIWSINYFDRHVWGKWQRLGSVRRFVIVWWMVLAIGLIGLGNQTANLKKAYLTAGPASGGIYREGLIGAVKSINPILPDNQASTDVGRLIFNGLTRLNHKGALELDLAKNWEVSDDGKTYTFHLQPGVKWHDKVPFTAHDVVFTLQLIQNPDTRSPLASSWQGVTVKAKNNHTVIFSLPNAFAPFIYSTNFGILPRHLLAGLDPSGLRVAAFNQRPIGTGPFKFTQLNIEAKSVLLEAYSEYHNGAPKLEQFEFKLYESDSQLRQAYAQHQVNSISQVDASEIPKLALARVHEMTLLSEVGLFMRMRHPILADKSVRQAIAQSIDRPEIAKQLKSVVAAPVALPILPGGLGYTTSSRPPQLDLVKAKQLLDDAKWTAGKSGVRRQGDKPLKLTLVTSNTGSYPKLAELIKSNLKQVGIAIDVIKVDVTTLQQSYIRPRKYDLLLYGISIGPDPDVFAFWQSAQAVDPGLNLSEYSSAAADKELESARLTSDLAIRAARYKKFLANWVADFPAVMLYQPNYLYVTHADVKGVKSRRLGDPSDRFYGVENWTINTQPVQRRH